MIPKYSLNLLRSAALWLRGRSTTVWATVFGHSNLMCKYADDLEEIAAALCREHPICSRCGGLINAPLGRPVDPLDCACCKLSETAALPLSVDQQKIADMAMLMRQLIRHLPVTDPVAKRAHSYLKKHNLLGNPLRNS
jgi:hypothetical protein